MKKLLAVFALASFALTIGACSQSSSPAQSNEPEGSTSLSPASTGVEPIVSTSSAPAYVEDQWLSG